jgi:hypothetical protein
MQPGESLVYLTSVVGNFQGQLMTARLAVEGIECVLRGTSDGPYPLTSEVQVFVPASSLDLAREILLADAIDAAFIEQRDDASRGTSPWRRWLRRREDR